MAVNYHGICFITLAPGFETLLQMSDKGKSVWQWQAH